MSLLSFLFGGAKSGGFGRGKVTPHTRQKIESDWRQIDTLVKQGAPSQLRQALITADKTLDAAMKDIVSGEKMAERLKNSKDFFEYSLYDKIWKAHKMRNSIVHEAGYEPTHSMVTNSIEILRQGLNILGVKV